MRTADRRILTTVGAAMAALAMAMGIGRFALTALLPAMGRLGLSDAAAGMIAGLNLLGYLVASWLAGRVPPHRRPAVFIAAVAASALSTLAMAFSAAPWWWGFARAVAGPASGFVMVLGAALMLDRLTELGRVHLGGLAFSGIGLGIALSGTVAWLGGEQASALTGWFVLGAVSVLLGWPALGLAGAPKAATGEPARGPRGMVNRAAYLALLSAYTLEGFGYSVSGTFLSAIVARGTGSEAAGGMALAAAGVAAVPAFFLWQGVSRRHGIWAAMAAAYLVQAAGMLLPLFSSSPAAALVSAASFGGTFIAIVALTLAEARRLAGVAAIGAITAVYGIAQTLGPLFAGWVAEHTGSFDPAVLTAAVVVAGGGVILSSASARRRKQCPM